MVNKILGEEKGSVMILVVLALVVLIGFTGLVIDGGQAYLTKSRLQNAADAGALAGVTVSKDNSESEARKYTKLNGVEHGVKDTTVTTEFIAAAGDEEPVPVDAYTDAEIAEMKTQFATELNGADTSDLDVIKTADEYGVGITDYVDGSGDSRTFKTVPTKTRDQIIQEEKAILNGWSDSALLDEARRLGVDDSSWTSSDPKKFKDNKYEEYKSACINAIIGTSEYQDKIDNKFEKQSSTDYRALVIQKILEAFVADLQTEQTTITTGNLDRLKVTCTREVQNSFMGIFGFGNSTVIAVAEAENSSWAGDALPFINLDGYPTEAGEDLEAWNKVGPGDKERISNDDLIVSPHRIQVMYLDGITFKKGKVMSQIKDPLQNIAVAGRTVFLFSIKNSEVDNYQKKGDKELKNKDVIPLADVVLLECIVTEDWGGTGSSVISLEFVEVYDWDKAEKIFKSATGNKPLGGPRLVK